MDLETVKLTKERCQELRRQEVYRKAVSVRKGIQKGMDFTPLWLSKSCCDDECQCVTNFGCPCDHDCHCPNASLPYTSLSLSTDSLAIKLQFSTKSANNHYTMKEAFCKPFEKDGGTWQEPAQVGYQETKEPGIEEPEDAVDADSIRKGGGAAWARAEGLVPESGDWKHPKHWIRPEERPTEHRGYKIPGHLTDLELNINPGHRQIARGRDAAGRFKYIYSKEAVEEGHWLRL